MTCPHCGAEAPEGPKFCPRCARLLDSPLLRMKQELDALRGKPLHQQVAESMAERARMMAARTSTEPPPMPDQQPAVYRLQNAGPSPAPPSVLQERLGEMESRGKRKKGRRDSSSDETHSRADHRFRPSTHQHGADATLEHNAKQKAQAAAKAKVKAATEVPPPPERFGRPAAVTILGLLDVFGALLLFAVGVNLTMTVPEPRPPLLDSTRYVWFGLAGFFLLTGLGMWGRWRIARLMQMLIALPMLINYPLGSIYGVVLLLFLKGSTTQAVFQGKSPRQLTQQQWASAYASLRFSPVLAVLFVIFAMFPAQGLASLFNEYVPRAAIMIEQAKAGVPIDVILQTAQTGVPVGVPATGDVEPEPPPTGDPQTTAVEDVVTVMRAQAAYASLNGGFYDRIECVVAPANCIPNGDPRNAAKLLEPHFTRMERNGYVFQLRLSEPPETRPDTVSKSGTSEYAYRAVPIKGEGPGFCGDQTGTICTFDSKNVSGNPFKCPDGCTPVQRTEQP